MRVSSSASSMQPMTLGGVVFDATIERTRSMTADVPAYPVEKGFKVSDAVLKNPMEIQLKAVISAMPLTHRRTTGIGVGNVQSRIAAIMQLFYNGNPISLITDSGIYTNLVISALTVPETTEMRNAVEISITLKQVQITGGYGLEGDTILTTTGDPDFDPTRNAGSPETTELEIPSTVSDWMAYVKSTIAANLGG